jgi:hypothetical protein
MKVKSETTAIPTSDETFASSCRPAAVVDLGGVPVVSFPAAVWLAAVVVETVVP